MINRETEYMNEWLDGWGGEDPHDGEGEDTEGGCRGMDKLCFFSKYCISDPDPTFFLYPDRDQEKNADPASAPQAFRNFLYLVENRTILNSNKK